MRRFAPRAQTDLDDAIGWLLDHGSVPALAERLLDAVLAAAERLEQRPLLGRLRPELLPEPFRFWSIPRHNLLLIYRADEGRVTILRVQSTRRDFGPLLDELADEPDAGDAD